MKRYWFTGVALVALGGAVALPAQVPEAEYALRRATLMASLPDSAVLVALGAGVPREDYIAFVQAPRFWYLTGFLEPSAALVVVKRGRKASGTIFVLPRDATREAWTGARTGVEQSARRTGLEARPASDLRQALDSALAGTTTLYAVGDLDASSLLSPDDQFMASLRRAHPALRIEDASGIVDSMRARHSTAELALLRRAIDITVQAQREAMRTIAPGRYEYEIQALIEYTFRRNGAERPGFSSIVGSGPNATSLHYEAASRQMSAGDLLVMDIGASWHGYTADVTRTVPVSGTFTADQRALYQVVRDAQAAAESQAKIGGTSQAMESAANGALLAGLAKLGLIEGPNAVYDEARGGCRLRVAGGCSQLSLYYNHGLGHGIGLEVHDPTVWEYPPRLLASGAAFTIEPGLYIRANALDALPDTPRNRAMIATIGPAFERFKDFGIRIEDDYFVTELGVEWMSRAPREIADVEAAMKR